MPTCQHCQATFETVADLPFHGAGLCSTQHPQTKMKTTTQHTPELLDAAKQVVARWAAGDLGEAVRNLAAAILETSEDQAPLPPAGVSVYAVPMFHALRRIQVESSPEAEATAGDLRRALLQINRLASEALR